MAGLVDKLHDGYQLRAFDHLPVPVMKPCVVDGITGSTSLSYCATFKTINGETTAATETGVANAYATLDAFHRVKVWVEPPPAGAQYVRFFKQDVAVWKLLAEVAVPSGNTDAIAVWDQGQALTNVQPPTANTSGRPDYFLLLCNDAKDFQRAEMTDLQAFFVRMIEGVADQIHRAGDVITGCGMAALGSNRWSCDTGRIYAGGGFYVPVPAGEVQLAGVGTEVVGVRIVPRVVTHTEDPVLRNVDVNVPVAYRSPGADRLGVTVTWTVDDDASIPIQTFIDGEKVVKNLTPEKTEIQRMIAIMLNDLAGTFGVRNFQCSKLEHPTDTTKFRVRVASGGVAYPSGWRVELAGPQIKEIPKARDVQSVNESTTDPFVNYGGSVTGTVAGPFNLTGTAIKVRIGTYGNSHTVSFSADSMSAQDVCNAIANSVNAYPTLGQTALVTCTPVGNTVHIAARAGHALILEAVASDAYTLLGMSTGTYAAVGTRLYAINDAYVKAVTDISYGVEVVEAVTHDGTTHKDLLANANVYSILGASATAADCYDSKFDWNVGVDFGRTGNYIDFSLYGGGDPSNGQTIYVKYRYNRVATKGTRTLVEVTDIPITKGAEDGLDSLTYTGAASVRRVRDNVSVTGLTGAMIDCVEIMRVNDTTGQSTTEYSSYVLQKNSTATAHATSKVDWSGAGAQGVTPTGQPATGSIYYATVRAWYHEIEGDVVVADSYDVYSAIETIPGLTDLLRDWLDFRTGGVWPVAGENPGFDYEYYLSRVDRLIMGQDGVIQHIQGDPAVTPPVPPEQTGSYSVAVIRISPYTYSLDDVTVVSTGRLRMTQPSLIEMKDKLDLLYYFVATNYVEQTTVNEAAATVESKAIFSDSFSDHSRCDVSYNKNGIQFTAGIDTTEQCIRLPVESTDVRLLEVDDENSFGIRRVGNTVTLDYEETIYESQLKASSAINVNPDNVVNFNNATMALDPSVDVYMDTTQLADLNAVVDTGMEALQAALEPELSAEITYGIWHFNNGTSAEAAVRRGGVSTIESPGRQALTATREGTGTSLVVGQQTVDLGSRVVDITAIPMMRQIAVSVTARALAPNVDHALTFEGVAVNLVAVSPSVAGTATYEGKTTVRSDAAGTITATFTIPTGVPTGTAHAKLFSAVDPTVSSAATTFYSQGWMQETQNTTIGFASASLLTETVTETVNLQYVDPLAQTFLVPSNTGPEYFSALGLYFKKKDPTIPLTVQIRGTTNGYPNRVVYLSKTIEASAVLVSDDGSVETKIVFDNVVGFNPEEYAIIVMANSDEYEVWHSTVGEVDVATGEAIAAQTHNGVLFHSPNASTWVAMEKSDLKFKLYKSNFRNDLQIVFKSMTGFEAAQFIVMTSEFLGAPCNVSWSYSTNGGSSWTPIKAGVDVYLSEITGTIQLLLDVTNLGGSYAIIEKWAGILLQLVKDQAWYVSFNQVFTDSLNLPNSVQLYADMAVDSVRTITPYFSVDNGATLVKLLADPTFTPVAVGDGSYYEYRFVTPGEQTVEGASNTTPIVITSTGHGFQNNAIAVFEGIGGNTAANGTWRCTAVTTDTITLVDPITGADSVGNGAYTSGGTITMAEFSQFRTFGDLRTTNKARTPKARRWRGSCS